MQYISFSKAVRKFSCKIWVKKYQIENAIHLTDGSLRFEKYHRQNLLIKPHYKMRSIPFPEKKEPHFGWHTPRKKTSS